MNRASFDFFAEDLKRQGFSDEDVRRVLNKMLENGLVEGNDEIGYVLTEKGVEVVERQIYSSVGVR